VAKRPNKPNVGRSCRGSQKRRRCFRERYIAEALLPLFNLKSDDIPQGAPRDISLKIYDALGVIPRSDLQSMIAKMDEEQRNSLRSKKIRFGPLLVYLPELNKPAAVRLRALLLSVWHDKDLPAVVPADGIVSFSVEGQEVDKKLPIYWVPCLWTTLYSC